MVVAENVIMSPEDFKAVSFIKSYEYKFEFRTVPFVIVVDFTHNVAKYENGATCNVPTSDFLQLLPIVTLVDMYERGVFHNDLVGDVKKIVDVARILTVNNVIIGQDNEQNDITPLNSKFPDIMPTAYRHGKTWKIHGYDGDFKFVKNLGLWYDGRKYITNDSSIPAMYEGTERAGLFAPIGAIINTDKHKKQKPQSKKLNYRVLQPSTEVTKYSRDTYKYSHTPTQEQEQEVDRLLQDKSSMLSKFVGDIR